MAGVSGADILQPYGRRGSETSVFPGWDAAKSRVTGQEWKYGHEGCVGDCTG